MQLIEDNKWREKNYNKHRKYGIVNHRRPVVCRREDFVSSKREREGVSEYRTIAGQVLSVNRNKIELLKGCRKKNPRETLIVRFEL